MKNIFVLSFAFLIATFNNNYGQSITFSELNYNPDSTANSGNWVEILNYGSIAVDVSSWILKDADDLHSFKIPLNTVLQPGGRLVVVNDAQKFSTQYPFIPYVGEMTYNFSNSTDQVRLYNANGEIKVYMEYTDSLPWSKAVDGTGRTLEIKDPTQDPNNAANWFAGCMFGSPGFAYTPCNEPLVFDEINYNSDSLLDAGDWIELWNRSSGFINLTGYSFKDSRDSNIFYFPSNLQLAPQNRIVLVHDTAKFFMRHPSVANWIGPFDFNLSNEGELIRLFDFNGRIKFSMIYNDQSSGWPISADGDGYTLELLDATKDVNVAEDWFAGCLEGSPGYEYDPDCNVGISEIEKPNLFSINNLAGNSFVVHSTEIVEAAEIIVCDLTGRKCFEFTFEGNEMKIDLGKTSKGIYLVCFRTQSYFQTQKIVIQ
jgi:hypothetical protein